MQYRILGKTGYRISTISFGAWAIGGAWGKTNDDESIDALNRAIDCGVNFIDTADVYGDGKSERLISQVRGARREKIYVATKCGRRLEPHTAEGYTAKNIGEFVERSLRNLATSYIDLLQLHCPPTAVYHDDTVFDALDSLVASGKVRHYGVSVETVAEGITAMLRPGVSAVQVIYNIFRQKPADELLTVAQHTNVGIIARVPLASGLLTGKLSLATQFEPDDHRLFNRHGEAFDKGETFSGVDYDRGLAAVELLRPHVPEGITMAQFALRWILMNEAVTCAIPGARTVHQAENNAAAADLPTLTGAQMEAVLGIYNEYIRSSVHHLW